MDGFSKLVSVSSFASQMSARIGETAALYKTAQHCFSESSTTDMAAMRDALGAIDKPENVIILRSKAHSLKGTSYALGAARASLICKNIVSWVDAENVRVFANYKDENSLFGRLVAAIPEAIEELSKKDEENRKKAA